MGVPAFYRWLSEKYPKIVQDVLEDRVHLADSRTGAEVRLPFDSTRPNPNNIECDSLYIDMNGIIHPCSHPENGPQPETEEDMYENVCRYVDRLFRAHRPRQLLYLAIDGVAPRAKMNQQRARRFRAAQEARELAEMEDHIKQEMKVQGEVVPLDEDQQGTGAWDSNVITPGTPFMLNLAQYLRFYIRKRMVEDKAWKKIRVIFSDASVPGEGEHKIMEHIRLQRAMPSYNPNTVHILHGLDADLIMLALATHEAHFYISREEVTFGRRYQEEQDRRQIESGFRDAQKAMDEAAGAVAMALEENCQKPLQKVSIPILREYLQAEFAQCLQPSRLPFQPSLERLIDDIVFMCFFVGNDFLPHLPSLDIRDGALDYLFNVYKRILPAMGDYITRSGGNVNLKHVDVLLAEVGSIEDYVFSMKHANEQREAERREQMKENRKRQRSGQKQAPPPVAPQPASAPMRGRAARILERDQQRNGNDDAKALSRGHQAKEEARKAKKAQHMIKQDSDNAAAAKALKESLVVKSDKKIAKSDAGSEEGSATGEENEHVDKTETEQPADANVTVKTAETTEDSGNVKQEKPGKVKTPGVVGEVEEEFDADDGSESEEVEVTEEQRAAATKVLKEKVKAAKQKQLDHFSKNVEDNVRLHEKGWKDRYYSDKCKLEDIENHGGREKLFKSYVQGLCWVMKYYYVGCTSWKWYYPFHYAPFASDLKNIERFHAETRSFESSEPFNPVEQLMAVLPSDSAHAIPKAARWLMTDPESPTIDFYPKEVPVDPNGKAMPWLWVVLLPFIDEERLLSAMAPTTAKWTNEELLCNARGLDNGYLFVHRENPLSNKLAVCLQKKTDAKSKKMKLTDGDTSGCVGFSGSIRPPLSDEIYDVSGEASVSIPPPKTADRINRHDSLFMDAIEDAGAALCVAFSEPPKLSHKSVLLPGARVPPPCLTDDDRRIRRPRLNRGGATIANMGGATAGGGNQSHKSGYGSMNVNSYERELANRMGRGHEMYQTGNRAWGAMEPMPKRRRQNDQYGQPIQHQQQQSRMPPNQNPFMRNQQQQTSSGYQQRQQSQQPPWQQQQNRTQQRPPYQQQYNNSHSRNEHMHRQQNRGHAPPPPPPRRPHYQQRNSNHPPPYQQQSYPQQGGGGSYQQGQQAYNQRPPSQHQQRQQQGFNFRSVNQPPQQRQPPSGGGGRANADVMNNLRAQLMSTLKQNNRGS